MVSTEYIKQCAGRYDTQIASAFRRALKMGRRKPGRGKRAKAPKDLRYKGLAWCMRNLDEGTAH